MEEATLELRGEFGGFVADPRLPPSLNKALVDEFDYALRLRTGETVRFRSATVQGDYVTLKLATTYDHGGYDDPNEDFPFECPRGLDVRIADIVWCADAPEGS